MIKSHTHPVLNDHKRFISRILTFKFGCMSTELERKNNQVKFIIIEVCSTAYCSMCIRSIVAFQISYASCRVSMAPVWLSSMLRIFSIHKQSSEVLCEKGVVNNS